VNQIQNDLSRNKLNLLTIHAGRKNQSDANWNDPTETNQYQWEVTDARVIPQMKMGQVTTRPDIGIASISDILPKFFDKDALSKDFRTLDREEIKSSRIVPICLAAENSDFSGKTLKGAGWGWEYQEKPENENNPRNPAYSSCMTTELSLKVEHRFKNCDMQKIQANDWECRKDRAPDDYPVNECRNYFNKAEWTDYRSKLLHRFRLTKKKFDKLFRRDIMYVPNGITTINCTRLDWTQWPHGWCELPGSTAASFKWGICSSSCSKDLMKVI